MVVSLISVQFLVLRKVLKVTENYFIIITEYLSFKTDENVSSFSSPNFIRRFYVLHIAIHSPSRLSPTEVIEPVYPL